jgi:DNA polymerase elongation subunit (family B)
LYTHDFKILNADTDSITIYKDGFTPFGEKERTTLLAELNSQSPEGLLWEDDGYYHCVIVIRAKNYVLWDGKKLTYKGSALRASTKPPALKQFIKDIIQSILDDKSDFSDIYLSYVKEINNIQDMSRWCSRKTLTDKIYSSERLNETKVLDALEGSEYVEGDRVHMFYKQDDTLELLENFTGDYNKTRLLKQLFDTSQIFKTVLDTKTLFPNYSLKKNQQLLQDVLNEV